MRFGIEIPITDQDRTAAPIAAAHLTLTALKKAALKVGAAKIAPTITLQDKRSAAIASIESSLTTLGRGIYTTTLTVAGNAVSTVHSLFETLTSRLGMHGGVTINGGIHVTLQIVTPADPKQAAALATAIADPVMAEIAKRAAAASFNSVAPE